MDCLASLIPLRIRQWISLISGGVQKQESIIFMDAERGPDDLVVTFLRNRLYDRCSWSEYKSIGPEATAAVVQAGWSCSELDREVTSLHKGIFDERSLNRLRQQARNKHHRISYGNPADHSSVFEWAER
ncbi:hypothetical protein N7468_004175 [Penicillium chermesinum]|uniref:Uncharacterized protein n=1 Tax=Penicillium chermesinum TaxID=63820 RepID=A0A9W9TSB7_9EURO|nr:uncharacterized protein N7468_004175 [Penicillium chermesinum]KAJ5239556.1 hypothetical protein N7468_004175 [Penicillium chermesinum]KAJ6141194.1 hypothetical protein N7470_010090 [Penicillium chermesinum]